MRGSTLAVLAILASSAAPAQAQERFTDPFGGRGGQQFISRCPPSTAVTGVLALTGAYINGIAPICDGRQGPGAGGGGDKRSAQCPAGSVVRSIDVLLLRSENHLVKDLGLHCVDRRSGINTADVALATPGRFTQPFTNRFLGNTLYPSSSISCGTQEVIGLQGRAGVSIDALGLICGSARAR